MSGSGFKQMVVNTNERPISSDINRLQKFAEADVAEIFRALLDSTSDWEQGGLGVQTTYSTLGNPLRAEVLSGLTVRPQVGSLDVRIDAGLLFAMSPDGSADESNYKLGKSPGVLVNGVLAITPNAAGSARFDFIECRPASNATVETENRDIFDPALGTFGSQLVTKTTQRLLEFRVRAGTAGAGLPAFDQGWLPLCVAYVPAGASSNNSCDFWDVRPLVGDRVQGVTAASRATQLHEETNLVVDTGILFPEARLSGTLYTTIGSRRAGGIVRRGSPGTDAEYVDLNNAVNRTASFSMPVSGFVYVYLAFPAGLPRWVRYTDFTTGSRVPRGGTGIPVLSTVAPAWGGLNPSALTLATWSGGTQVPIGSATCIQALYVVGSTIMGSCTDSRVQWIDNFPAGGTSPGIPVSTSSISLDVATFTLTPGTDFPAGAKALHVTLDVSKFAVTTSEVRFSPGGCEVLNNDGVKVAMVGTPGWRIPAGSGSYTYRHQVSIRVPVPTQYPVTSTPGVFYLRWNFYTLPASGTPTATAYIHGWEF